MTTEEFLDDCGMRWRRVTDRHIVRGDVVLHQVDTCLDDDTDRFFSVTWVNGRIVRQYDSSLGEF